MSESISLRDSCPPPLAFIAFTMPPVSTCCANTFTPEPWSIRRNEPSFLPRIAASLAGIRGEPLSVIAEQTTANVLRVFSRIKKPS